MSHFAVVVLSNDGQSVDDLLAPYDENGTWFAEGSRWDWWVVGGRFTGALTNYDPTTDPANWELCGYCDDGITTRRIADMYPAYEQYIGQTCIQCKGTSKVLSFQLAEYEGDVVPVRDLDIDAMRWIPTAVVTPDGAWHEQGRPGWFGYVDSPKADEDWAAEVAALFAAHPDATATLVDCHV